MKKVDKLLALATVGLVPFIGALIGFLRKGPDAPVTQRDLLCIFGIQLALIVALAIKVLFFSYGIAVVGG